VASKHIQKQIETKMAIHQRSTYAFCCRRMDVLSISSVECARSRLTEEVSAWTRLGHKNLDHHYSPDHSSPEAELFLYSKR
jgi:hypothetical protein